MDLKRRNVVIALMVAMFLGAVEGTVITTAIPTIVKELNGFELISLVFSLYLLTSAISTPIYGKLSDLYGRKNILSIGIIIFLIGSSLCGLSLSMYYLIAFRALQGLGAGAIFTVTYTIVGDIFTIEERAKVQGSISTVWGIASLIGPFLGGFLIDYLSWHWVFFINIPFGILSIILLQKNLDESFKKKKHKIDYSGTFTLSASIISFLYVFMIGDRNNKYYTTKVVTAVALSIVFFIIFCFIEKRAEEPVIPFEIFTHDNIIVNAISFLASATVIAIDVYIPIYIQNVLGFGATVSGLSMAPMSISWLISSIVLSKAIPRYGERIVIGISTLISLIGCGLLPTLGVNSSLFLVIIYVFITGFGFGGAFTTLTIVVQESVAYNQRGAATASNSLLRTLGQTIGVSVFGGIFNAKIMEYFRKIGIEGIQPNNLYSTSSGSGIINEIQMRLSLCLGLKTIFLVLIIISFICFILSFLTSEKLRRIETLSN